MAVNPPPPAADCAAMVRLKYRLGNEPLQATPEIPMLHGSRLSLAKTLANNRSYFHLLPSFKELGEELGQEKSLAGDGLENTRTLLNDMRVTGKLFDLLLLVPKQVLEAMVLGTVAYDHANGLVGYDRKGPGVYVFGISIESRGGKFLTKAEMDKFIDNFESYVEGARHFHGVQSVLWPPQRLAKFAAVVKEVDRQFSGLKDPPGPRFFSRGSGYSAYNIFLDSMRDRRNALERLDPTGSVQSIQSPLYVGCSNELETRIAAYDPKHNDSGFGSANNLYALTMSLLSYQGLVPKVHVVAAIRAIEQGTLDSAEILIAGLARSYPRFGGFNACEAGIINQKSFDENFWTNQGIYVTLTMPFSMYNVELCNNAAQLINDIDTALETVQNASQEIQRLMSKVDEDVKELVSAGTELQAALVEAEAVATKRVAALNKETGRNQRICSLLQQLTEHLKGRLAKERSPSLIEDTKLDGKNVDESDDEMEDSHSSYCPSSDSDVELEH
ncbi:hypothetical protein B0T14DRAFT_570867 [Immersiella caudata]|uniref:Uncharacterized protein n=1 Tax=Immersiella caudata TaxID=314043 RepID=A0AA39U4R7_9PEZI|nr:hypothetical protein B0T14DRAFT_570867 [Immersiella caudata]